MRLFTDPGSQLHEAIDSLKARDHTAVIYNSPEEKFDTLLPFVRSGLRRGERYMYIASEEDARSSLEVFDRNGIETAAALAGGSMVLVTPADHLPQGRFQPDSFISFLSQASSDALAAGYGCLRLCVEKSSTLGTLFDPRMLAEYEVKMDALLARSPLIALCAYDANRFSSSTIREVISTHRNIVLKGILCNNPWHLPPEELSRHNRLDLEVKRLLKGMLETELQLYELQMQNDMFMSMFRSSPAMASVKDLQGRYLLINPAGAGFLKRTQEEILGHTDEELLPREAAQWRKAADAQALESEQPLTTEEWLTISGETMIFLSTRGAYCNREGRAVGVFAISADITERRGVEKEILAYEEQLRAKVAEISRVEEQERRRIASALHDEIGQTLALVKIKLETLTDLKNPEKLVPAIGRVRELLDGIISETRSLTVELRPPLLYELGLETAVQALCEEFRQQYAINFSFEDDGSDKGLDDDLRIFLYRAVRELLVNVVKHSQATSARVCMCKRSSWISIQVIDNGAGFEAEPDMRLGPSRGFGLFSIRERLRHLGGRLNIRSRRGEGTRIIIDLPRSPGDMP